MVIFILQKMVTETWGSSKAVGQHPEHLSRLQSTKSRVLSRHWVQVLLKPSLENFEHYYQP